MTSLITENIVLTVPDGRSLSSRANRININELQANTIIYSTETVTATGTVRADATAVSDQYAFVTVPTNLTGVYLPDPTSDLIGRSISVYNLSASNQLNIYPYSTAESIAGQSAGTPYVLDPNTSVSLMNTSLTTWEVIDFSEIPGIIIGTNGNNFYGSNAGNTTVSGSDNTGIGNLSMHLVTSGSRNTGLGSRALRNVTSGSDNIAVGYSALAAVTTVSNLVAIGSNSLASNTTGIFNLALGNNALTNNTIGDYNIGVGYQSLLSNIGGSRNIGIGYRTLAANTSGTDNVAIGYLSMVTNTIGLQNTAIGSQSLQSNLDGNRNVAIGYSALGANTSGSDNVAIGYLSLSTNTTGSQNIAIGTQALQSNIGGTRNTTLGYQAMKSNTSGVDNLAIGYLSLTTNTIGNYNVGFGTQSLQDNLDGNRNTALGHQALMHNTSGVDNVAVGYQTLNTNTIGISNIGLGSSALFANLSGSNNIAVGVGSLATNVIGSRNIAIGTSALATVTGSDNLAIGQSTLTVATIGTNNVAVGNGALSVLTTGSNNIAIGVNAGSALTIADSNNIDIGHTGVVGDINIIRIGTAQVKTFIAGIRGVSVDAADGIPLYISSTGQIGTGGASTSAVTTMSAFGNTPNANGATITGANLQLQPASASFPGGVSTAAQSFAGAKTFTNGLLLGAYTDTLNVYASETISLGIYHGVTLLQTSSFVFERIGNVVTVIMPTLALLRANFPGDQQTAVQSIPADYVPSSTSTIAYGNMTTIYSQRPSAGANGGWIGYLRVIFSGGIWQFFVNPDYDNGTVAYLNFGDAGTGTHDGWMAQTVTYLLS